MELEPPPQRFSRPTDTKARLALICYAHVLEMDFPYELVANLLRLHLGIKYALDPLSHLNEPIKKKLGGIKKIVGVKEASSEKKIKAIEELSAQAGMPDVGAALRSIYNPVIRNAVYHSDYAIRDDSTRLLSEHFQSKKTGALSPLIPFEDIVEITGTRSRSTPRSSPYGSEPEARSSIFAASSCPTTRITKAFSSSCSTATRSPDSRFIGRAPASAFAQGISTTPAMRRISDSIRMEASTSL